MKKEAMVTRTIRTMDAEIMVLDTATAVTQVIPVTLPMRYHSNDAILKAVNKTVLEAGQKAVHVVRCEVREALYGMSESEFMQHAKLLPPRKKTKAEIETEQAIIGSFETNEEGE